jgi:hypothetical protein
MAQPHLSAADTAKLRGLLKEIGWAGIAKKSLHIFVTTSQMRIGRGKMAKMKTAVTTQ